MITQKWTTYRDTAYLKMVASKYIVNIIKQVSQTQRQLTYVIKITIWCALKNSIWLILYSLLLCKIWYFEALSIFFLLHTESCHKYNVQRFVIMIEEITEVFLG
jgi:hypothetical protein